MEKTGVIISLMVMGVAMMAHGGYDYEVFDTDNEVVNAKGLYYVVDEAAHEEYSEDIVVSYASRSLEAPCPRVAVVPNSHISPLPHVPVRFYSENLDSFLISESEPLSINFEVSDWPCLNQKTQVWTVNGRNSPVTPYSEITFGGSPNTRRTNFTIEVAEKGGYKFVHVDSETGKTSVIGVQSVQPSGFKRLVLLDMTQQPFVVAFKNANKLFKSSSFLTMVPFYNSFN